MTNPGKPAADVPLGASLGRVLSGPPNRYLLVLLHALVCIVLSYQLLFPKSAFLASGLNEMLVAVLIASVLGVGLLPSRLWATKWLTGMLVVSDTLVTSCIIFLSGNASTSLYLTYFLIMLLAALAPTLKQMIGLSLLLCAAHGATLYVESGQGGAIAEGHLLQIPILFVLALFYGVTTESTRKLSQDKTDLLLQIRERKRAEEANQRTQAFITSIVENLPTMLFVKDAHDLKFVQLNKAGEELLGYAKKELIGKTDHDVFPREQADFFAERDRKVLTSNTLVEIPEEPIQTKHKRSRTLHTKKIPILDENGHAQYLLGISEDITERKQAEEALRLKTEQLEAISESITQFLDDKDWHKASSCILRSALRQTSSECGFMGVVKEGPVFRVLASEGLAWGPGINGTPRVLMPESGQGTQELEFTDLDNFLGRVITSGRVILATDSEANTPSGGLPITNPHLQHFLAMPLLHGSEVVGVIGVANRPGGYMGQEQAQLQILTQAASVLYDSYRRQQRESELQAQLRQSQKMEAIGRLAGGIAHDFNNLLTVIMGQSHYLLGQLRQDDPGRKRLAEIKAAGDRASALTQQLLAFSRRQMLTPRVLDLNGVVSGLEAMLLRLIGEHIHLAAKLDPHLGTVKADPGQIEQVLLNLVINARDSMPEGGSLTIETSNVEFPSSYREGQLAPSGPYVVLVVSDTGCGMDSETQAHIFEPFFTTKEPGKGTGLGLATTYGIIKQSGGYVFVDSEPGRGSTFRIYLPRMEAAVEPAESKPTDSRLPSGTETVLLVEDNPGVRGLLRYSLQENGYVVLEAQNGSEALEVARQHPGPIHLLLTDMVMPRLSGPELVDRLGIERPDMKVLYISGYSEDMWAHQNISDSGHRILKKPFTPDVVIRAVREVLDSEENQRPMHPSTALDTTR